MSPSSILPFAPAPRRSPDQLVRRALAVTAAAYDAKLVQRFHGGDETAFLEIMERYRTKIHAITCGILHNHADAEELTQDTFIRAHRGLARFRGDSSLATWLHRIAVNLARNRYWYFFRRHRHATLSLDCPMRDNSTATIADLVAAEEADPARATTTAEFVELIGICMEKLSPRHREILTLRNILHRSYDEIATALGLSVGTVKSRIARARENIRALLAAECPEFGAEEGTAVWFDRHRPTGLMRLAFGT